MTTPDTATTAAPPTPEQVKEATGKLAGYIGGYVATWTMDIGARTGLLAAIAAHAGGISSADLARETGTDPLYVDVWCRNAYGAEILEERGGRYSLPPAMAVPLLGRDSPAYTTGTVQVFVGLRDAFAALRERLRTGERIWWDTAPREFVDAVGESSRGFYTRLLAFVDGRPDLARVLADGGTLLEVAVGLGTGLVRFAARYPAARFVGVDGDAYSLEQARAAFGAARAADRVRWVRSTFEDYAERAVADLALISISLHEARDKARAVAAMRRALKPGGTIIVSEFPYPDTLAGLRTPPARVMSGVQYFEAMIDDQLLPTSSFSTLLAEAGFGGIEVHELSPVHVVILGRA